MNGSILLWFLLPANAPFNSGNSVTWGKAAAGWTAKIHNSEYIYIYTECHPPENTEVISYRFLVGFR